MTPAEYLRREYTLGHEALTFARMRPECAQSLFGRDVTSRSEADYCREFVERERPKDADGDKAVLHRLLARFDLGPRGSINLRDSDLGLIARYPAIPDKPIGTAHPEPVHATPLRRR